MNKQQLAELLKYSSPKELYIVTHNNLLKLLFCPFKVVAIQDIISIKCGQIVWVEEVKITLELKTIYIIKRKAYHYHYFEIIYPETTF